MLELAIAALLAFGVGSYIGAKQVPVQNNRPPEVWQPLDHKELLRACAIACGEAQLAGYSAIYGKCQCKQGEQK